ncbi:50S ribosomal protein L11 [archaeon]|nr:50S ribosomal protein L11 [archaeon]
MSKKEKIDLLVEGGKASANQQMAQALGPKGINIKDVLEKINEKTASFKGMKVPVTIEADIDDKTFEISIGTPPVSELIKNELNLKKGSGIPNKDKVANIAMEQVVKITQMKKDSILHNDFKSAVKSVIGSCNSLGILIEGLNSKEINEKINNGDFDDIINNQKIELSEDKKKKLEEKLEEFKEEFKGELAKMKSDREEKEKKSEKKVEEKPSEEKKVEAPKEEKK